MPFIMLSGAADRVNVEASRDHGVNDFMAKPFSERAGSGLNALLTRAGFPASMLAAFRAALNAVHEVGFVGDHDGVVSVYRGLPLQVGGLELNGLYLQTTTPLSSVAPSVLVRIDRHDLHRKAAALALVHDAQGVLP